MCDGDEGSVFVSTFLCERSSIPFFVCEDDQVLRSFRAYLWTSALLLWNSAVKMQFIEKELSSVPKFSSSEPIGCLAVK